MATTAWKPARATVDGDGSDSDSDNSGCPKQEPEFVFHFADDDVHRQLPPPRRPNPPPLHRPSAPAPALPGVEHGRRSRRKAIALFIVEIALSAAITALAVVTTVLSGHLPKEYSEGGVGVLWCLVDVGNMVLAICLIGLIIPEELCGDAAPDPRDYPYGLYYY